MYLDLTNINIPLAYFFILLIIIAIIIICIKGNKYGSK